MTASTPTGVVAVRTADCTSSGLPDHLRITARPAPDRDHLVAAPRSVLASTSRELL